MGIYIFIFMFFEVILNSFIIHLSTANHILQHIQHECTLRVIACASAHAAGNRIMVFIVGIYGCILKSSSFPIEIIFSKNLLIEKSAVIGSKVLVHPHAGTGAAGNHIAKPLVGQFMRIYTYVIPVEKAAVINHVKIAVNGCRSIFHSAIHKILHGNLRVAFPTVFHADLFFIKINHFGTVLIGCGYPVFPIGRIIKMQGNT